MVDKVRAYGVFATICIALILNFWFGVYTAEAKSNSLLMNAQATNTNPTFREDSALTNSCIEAGQSKDHCLCLTSIYKHKLTKFDYKAAVTLYQAEKSQDPNAKAEARASLMAQNYSESNISRIDALRGTLVDSETFTSQCHYANMYFAKTSGKKASKH